MEIDLQMSALRAFEVEKSEKKHDFLVFLGLNNGFREKSNCTAHQVPQGYLDVKNQIPQATYATGISRRENGRLTK